MLITIAAIKKIYKKNQDTRQSTYLAPKLNFDSFIRDELCTVKSTDNDVCTIFRHMDGNFYNLTPDQLKNFKCVGSCNC